MASNTPEDLHNKIIELLKTEGPMGPNDLAKYTCRSRGTVYEALTTMSYIYAKLWENDRGLICWNTNLDYH